MWYALSPDIRTDYVKQIQLTELELDDNIFVSRGILNSDVHQIFKMQDMPTRILPY